MKWNGDVVFTIAQFPGFEKRKVVDASTAVGHAVDCFISNKATHKQCQEYFDRWVSNNALNEQFDHDLLESTLNWLLQPPKDRANRS